MRCLIQSKNKIVTVLLTNFTNAGTKHLNDPNALIECSNTMGDVYEDIDDYNP